MKRLSAVAAVHSVQSGCRSVLHSPLVAWSAVVAMIPVLLWWGAVKAAAELVAEQIRRCPPAAPVRPRAAAADPGTGKKRRGPAGTRQSR